MSEHFLVFLPGIMGSELRHIGEGPTKAYENVAVWGEDLEVLADALSRKPGSLSRPHVQAGKILREIRFKGKRIVRVYGPLLDFFYEQGYRDGKNFCGFAYDWRKDNRETASLLGAFLRRKADEGVRQFKVVAHSMGGVVFRLLLVDPANKDLQSRIGLFIQIATPVLGSSRAFYTLKVSPELHCFLNVWGYLKQHLNPQLLTQLMDSIRSFPSLFQLLPGQSEQILQNDSGDHCSAVEDRVWPAQYSEQVESARTVQKLIATCSFPRMVTVFSTEIITDYHYLVDQDFNLVKRLPSSVKGDGTVTRASAVYDTPTETRVPITDFKAVHDWLPNHPNVLELLALRLRT